LAERFNILDLIRFFNRTDSTGERVYPLEDVRAFVPVIIQMFGSDLSPQDRQDAVGNRVDWLGLAIDANPDDAMQTIQGRLAEYYRENPLNERLKKDLQEFIRERLMDEVQGSGKNPKKSQVATGPLGALAPPGRK